MAFEKEDNHVYGTAYVPFCEWINPDKIYTCGGNPVCDIKINLFNKNGMENQYPVTGTVTYRSIIANEYPVRYKRKWSLAGMHDILHKDETKDLSLFTK